MIVVPLYDNYIFYGSKAILNYIGLDYDENHAYFNVRLHKRSEVIKGYAIDYIEIPSDIYEILKIQKKLYRKDFVALLNQEELEEIYNESNL